MRILVLSHYFPPEVNAPASRTFEHCREWANAGHDVTVVTCAPSHPTGKIYPGYRNRIWQRTVVDGVHVIRVWTYPTPNEKVIRRTLNFLSYFFSVCLATPFLPASDVVVSTSPQFFCGLAGYVVSRLKRVPWVLEIRDLWPESIAVVGAVRHRHLLRPLEWLESWAYRKADHIVVVTKGMGDHIESRGIPASKLAVITNGANLDLFSRSSGTTSLRQELGLEGKFVAAYFGTVGMAHPLETVVEAAELLRDDPRIAFLIAGRGANRARIEKMLHSKQLDNVILLDQQPKERMPMLWATCDASIVILRKSPLFLSSIPSKLFETMAMARPVILGIEGESRSLVESAGCGLPIEPENPTELAAAVKRLADDPAQARAMGDRGARLVVAKYSRAHLASTFEALLRTLVRPSDADRDPAPPSAEEGPRAGTEGLGVAVDRPVRLASE